MQLDETIALRTRNGNVLPLIERGTALPCEHRETLSTASDAQPSVQVELVATGRGVRTLARLEVAVPSAPRGVPKALLVVRGDDEGSIRVTLDAEHGSANAVFSVAIAR